MAASRRHDVTEASANGEPDWIDASFPAKACASRSARTDPAVGLDAINRLMSLLIMTEQAKSAGTEMCSVS